LQAHLYNLNGQLLQNHSLSSDDATYVSLAERTAAEAYILQVLNGEGRILGVEKIVMR